MHPEAMRARKKRPAGGNMIASLTGVFSDTAERVRG